MTHSRIALATYHYLGAFVVAAAMLAGACERSDGEQSCTPQSRQACTGANGCPGERTCEGTPVAWSACHCSAPADSGALEAGTGVRLGSRCESADNCPVGAVCLQNDSRQLFGGAPPVGTCVATCDPITGCARFQGATCVNVDDPMAVGDAGTSTSGLCFESCQIGAAATGAETIKCHGRAQIACTPVESASPAAGYCRPICTTSGECLTGVCDPARGVCVGRAPADPAFGLRCPAPPDAGAGLTNDGGTDAGMEDAPGDAPDAERRLDAGSAGVPVCAGLCVDVGGSTTLCSRRCLFGSTDECAPALDGRRRGGCLFVTRGGGIGDLGYCAELCDCNGDCSESSFVCDAFDDQNLEAAFTRKGVCTPPGLVINRTLPCAP